MTLGYRVICVLLVAMVVAAGCLGWHYRGGKGLAVWGGIAVVVAGAIWVGITLLWAMTQDGG